MMDLHEIRSQLPALQQGAYLNTGSNGPLPLATAQAIAAAAQAEFELGRLRMTHWTGLFENKTLLRSAFASLLNAPPDSVAFTHSSTEGINLTLWGLPWRAGDEIITTTLEHPGLSAPLAMLRQRFGVVVRFVDVGRGERARVLDGVARAFTARTRLVALSHVNFVTGAIFPLGELAEMAHQRGAWILADAAQSIGAIPVDVQALGVDFYAGSGQKWLCGPEGTGVFYVHPDRLDDLLPSFSGYTTALTQDHRGWLVPQTGAPRYESITHYTPALSGLRESLRWLADDVGWSTVFERTAMLAQKLRALLAEVPGLTIFTPENQQAGLVTLDLDGWSPQAQAGLSGALSAEGYAVRNIPQPPYGLRVSTGFFNTEDELQTFVEQLRTCQSNGPSSVKVPSFAASLPARYVRF